MVFNASSIKNGKENDEKRMRRENNLTSGGGTVVGHLPKHSKVKSLRPDAADTKYGRVNYHKKIMLQKQCDQLWSHSGRALTSSLQCRGFES